MQQGNRNPLEDFLSDHNSNEKVTPDPAPRNPLGPNKDKPGRE
jgi:hypothetical protein